VANGSSGGSHGDGKHGIQPGSAGASDLEVELAVYRQALERSRADMQAFAYSVSHDLRAPLRAIQGFSRILLEDYSSKLDGEAQQFLRHVIHNTQQLTSQMDDLLRFSRAGKQSPSKIEIDAAALVREAIAEVESDSAAGVTFKVETLPAIYADPVLLRQALVELLGNAVKFSRPKPGGVIAIGSRSDSNASILTVSDQGVGFDPAHAGKLFQVFQKIHNPGEFPGNGIGLAIVKRIVEAHGGCVEAQGSTGQGASFSMALPKPHLRAPLECIPQAPHAAAA
jgi:signal transduction histidine kinase